VSSTNYWYLTRASGIVALLLLTATMVLGLVTTNRIRARNWPGFAQQELHRRLSMITVVFLGLHVVTSVLDSYVSIGWISIFVPFVSSYGRFWVGVGALSLDFLLVVLVSSLLRAHMNASMWRALHWVAYASWPVALAHTYGFGTDSDEPWVILLGVVCVAAVGVALLWRQRVSAQLVKRRDAPRSTDNFPKHPVHSERSVGAPRGK
jgi:methionine sulfoxide reductase heme-binding subunit